MSDGEINVDSIDGEVLTSANIVGQLYPQGEKGDKGDKGDDGFSPTVTTEKVGKTTTITITDAEGVHTATILDGADGQGSGDMRTEVYDINHNGIVDDAEKVNGHTVGTDVPANAVFTDTTYTAGTGIDITGNVITNTQTSAEWGNITGTLSDQTDLQNALDDKADTSDIPTKVSDLTNDSGFIDKDVNNLTNYDTSTAVDTKISNSEEVLIGSDSGIKASHELWIDPNDVTPIVNSEISNEYGTAQNLGYSQEYANGTFATKDLATMSRDGLMSSADFSKLSGMAINNSYGTSTTEGYSQNYVNGKANLSTTPQTPSGDRKISEISLGWDSVNNTGYTLQMVGSTGGQDVNFSSLISTSAYDSFGMAKMPFGLSDGETKTFNPTPYGVYMFLNTHVYRGCGILIINNPSVGLKVVNMFGSSSDLNAITVTKENSGSIRIAVTGQCRGQLFVLNAGS